MDSAMSRLAYRATWWELLPLLGNSPRLVHVASERKGYTPLHQAAWHGANLAVVGELLALAADRSLKTRNKGQTARDMAVEKHADRADLEYVLAPGKRTLAQSMRKVVADTPDLFGVYDGNQVLCDRLIECFGTDSCYHVAEEIEVRIEAAFRAVTGVELSFSREVQCGPNTAFEMATETRF